MTLDTLIGGDCRQVLQTLPDGCVDCCVTSPPYNIGLDYGTADDRKSDDDYLAFTRDYLAECYRVLKDDGRFCLNIGYKVSTVKEAGIDYVELLNLINSIGYTLRETIIWVKSKRPDDPQSFCGSNTAWGSWMSAANPICRARMEFIFVLNKNSFKKHHRGISTMTRQEFMDYASTVWYFPAERSRLHKAPFPVELPYRCIQFYTYHGDVVLDPFVGSGTTAVACVRTGRRYIGIEQNPDYIRMAEGRIQQEKQQLKNRQVC
ncbi:MAG: site-specific DNA-methyltransferase [Phycisphaerae bacterium]|nr:site-specific DNA-methyltransferase [Phycisphaerae bacterium]